MNRMGRYPIPPVAVLLAVMLAGAAATAQETDRGRALDEQLGRIFGVGEYAVPRFGPARWLPDGAAYTTVERSADRADARDIVRYDAVSGARSILIAGAQLMPADAKAPLSIDDYAWSAGRPAAARVHQYETGVAPEHARRLLGLRYREREAPAAWRTARPSPR